MSGLVPLWTLGLFSFPTSGAHLALTAPSPSSGFDTSSALLLSLVVLLLTALLFTLWRLLKERTFTRMREVQVQRAQSAAEFAVTRLAAHIERTPLALIEWDSVGRVAAWNPAAERVFGLTASEAMGRDGLALLIPPQLHELVGTRWRRVREGQKLGEINLELERADSTILNCRWYDVPLTSAGSDGKCGHLSIVNDLSKQRAIEAESRESRRSLKTLLANLPGMAYRCRNDQHWTMEFVSEGCSELTGYHAEELVENAQVAYADLLVEEDRGRVWDEVQHGVFTDAPFRMTYRIRTKAGETRWVWEQGRAVYDGDELVALEGFITDITEHRKAEEERIRLQGSLLQAQKMEAVGQLAGGVAHDFNNLLTVVTGAFELLRADLAESDEARDLIDTTENALAHATTMTRSLLTFSRELPTNKRALDLCEALPKACSLLRRLLPQTIDLDVETPSSGPLRVHADETQLQQVLLNLAINARDAMNGRGKLRVALERIPEPLREAGLGASLPPCVARLVVEDDGPGISEELKTRIFEPFFSTKPSGRGTGLGLSIVHGIVQEHGGTLRLDSVPGHGARFTIELPTVAPDELADAPEDADGTASQGGGLVLVAEDNQQIRSLTERTLARAGFTLLSAEDGARGKQLLQEHLPALCLLVLDIDLPHLSGVDLLRMARRTRPDLPALLVTGGAVDEGSLPLDDITRFLRKPFPLKILGELASELVTHDGDSASEAADPA